MLPLREPHDLFDDEHWRQLAAASAQELSLSEQRQHRAHESWLGGRSIISYAEGLGGLGGNSFLGERAADCFSEAILADPGMADAYAGLLHLEANNVTVSAGHSDLLTALALTAARFGEEQQRFGRRLRLVYVPLFSIVCPVENADDLRILKSLDASNAHDFAGSEEWLSLCSPDNPRAQGAAGFVALLQDRWDDALDHFDQAAADTEVGIDAALGKAAAWAGLSMLGKAQEALEETLALSAAADLSLEARDAIATIFVALGDEEQARCQLELIYLTDPSYGNVAERLGLSGQPFDWDEFLRSLRESR